MNIFDIFVMWHSFPHQVHLLSLHKPPGYFLILMTLCEILDIEYWFTISHIYIQIYRYWIIQLILIYYFQYLLPSKRSSWAHPRLLDICYSCFSSISSYPFVSSAVFLQYSSLKRFLSSLCLQKHFSSFFLNVFLLQSNLFGIVIVDGLLWGFAVFLPGEWADNDSCGSKDDIAFWQLSCDS